MCSTDAVPSLVGADGLFLGKWGFRDAVAAGRVQLAEVTAEVAGQLDAFRRLMGRDPDHFDGHQHAHVVPGVPAAMCVALGGSVSAVRLPRGHTAALATVLDAKRRELYAAVSEQCDAAADVFRGAGMVWPDTFVGYTVMGADCTPARVLDAVRRAKSSGSTSCEVMVHPGLRVLADDAAGCGAGADEFSRSADRETELATLKDAALCGELTSGWELGTFGSLPAERRK